MNTLTYETSAEYILAEIERAGLKSPSRILKLVDYFYALTKYAAAAERFSDFYINDSMVVDFQHYPPITKEDIERAEPWPWPAPERERPTGGGDIPPPPMTAMLCTHIHGVGEPCGGYPRPKMMGEAGCPVWCHSCKQVTGVYATGECTKCVQPSFDYPPGLIREGTE